MQQMGRKQDKKQDKKPDKKLEKKLEKKLDKKPRMRSDKKREIPRNPYLDNYYSKSFVKNYFS